MKNMESFYEQYWKYRKETNHVYSNAPRRITQTSEILAEYEIQKILDIGCGEGMLGRVLDDRYEIIGIDISDQALNLASDHYDNTRQLNVEKENLTDISYSDFDAVVCLELLEHVFNPEDVLQEILSIIHKDGLFISSFPNFVFWRYRLDMLRGLPPQDYTLYSELEHIQDFTIESYGKLIRNVGFDIKQWHPQCPLPKLIPQFFGQMRPSLFANQIVVESKVMDH
jgi:2-polyprenyl-6-hydroxyphenyl methylase/3-demethylubiquinone-9 3-methyltransferase